MLCYQQRFISPTEPLTSDRFASLVVSDAVVKTISEVRQLTNKAVAEALDGLPAYKMHCSVLAEEAIRSALEDYYQKHPEKRPGDPA